MPGRSFAPPPPVLTYDAHKLLRQPVLRPAWIEALARYIGRSLDARGAVLPEKGEQMTLAMEAAAGPPEAEPRNNKIRTWLDSLSPEDRQAAEAVMSNPKWSHTEARALFARHGFDASVQTLGQYRREHHGAR